jgi:hypothetical protein
VTVSTESARFIEQTTVDRLVTLALNTMDKPEAFVADPARSVRRVMERYGDEPVEKALTRCRELLDASPNDFTAAGAVKFLESVLGG